VELLLPQTTIITPNSQEARRLARLSLAEDNGEDESDAEGAGDDPDLPECASRILRLGCEFVLITGTHENTPQVINTLYNDAGVVRTDTWERLPGSYHGSGCTLASAIAATLANGLEVPEAVREAQEYTWQALSAAFRPGMGQYIPDRFFWARSTSGEDGEEDENGQADAGGGK
jgi:hydroxymethylpyrimidine/phosphomethylpyrimidine kinase